MAQPANLAKPIRIERFAVLLRVQQHRLTADGEPLLHEFWREILDQRLLPDHQEPTAAITPTPAILLNQRRLQ
ncbi:hypothetical protein [Caballeronia catudaia]|uniref:hypothetical protein n=1 Tax=Caballeronia catudaia TaxID=1777136 RepID=UPI001F3B8DF7|nr:hypothetical protein [Caballeronia catudaia]